MLAGGQTREGAYEASAPPTQEFFAPTEKNLGSDVYAALTATFLLRFIWRFDRFTRSCHRAVFCHACHAARCAIAVARWARAAVVSKTYSADLSPWPSSRRCRRYLGREADRRFGLSSCL